MTINLNGRQFNPGSGFDPTLPGNENFLNTNATIFDAGAGVFYYDGDPLHTANFFGGVSAALAIAPGFYDDEG
ncbi:MULTISPECIES: hypothetical protein [unclassified Mucilaginibacter]|uniref:hypothetical protein n=1 Tax=unclassified Mucilaginibacter TaxID=2617802 RepID=UPI002AC9C724|nr:MULTISPECIES: hypothetical protein [unclassified Mucilaginibacter]MEB0260960.1 hypothetical protein [Mucilaginibacter sp. 10I4]MEB0279554.1 hypothetical protein [Mucilaginibacter sp. 10B2]MEB0302045.1 hypothetical protein [Mucilaginibacter sp. 5C4]WPX22578.1 hypothetical protein RHM67_14955 [Mucilaginibacter sp. 5C4]